MRQVSRFRADDGTEFDNKAECKVHEATIETQNALADILRPAYNTDRAEAVIVSMVNNAVEVRNALNKFIRKQPKAVA